MRDNRKASLIQRALNVNGGSIKRMIASIERAEQEKRLEAIVDLDETRSADIDDRAATGIAEADVPACATFDWNDTVVDRGTHSRRAPAATIMLRTGATVTIGAARHAHAAQTVVINTRDGHRQRLHATSAATLQAWGHAQTRGIMDVLGHHPVERSEVPMTLMARIRRLWSSPARVPTIMDHLADGLAARILDRAPEVTSHVKYLTDCSIDTGWVNGKPNIQTFKSDWLDVGDDVRILRSGTAGYSSIWNDHDHYMVAHPDWGVVFVPSDAILAAMAKRREIALDASLPASPTAEKACMIIGNPFAADLQRICLQALADNPELMTTDNERIDALARTHLPRLIARYRTAAHLASVEETGRLEKELAKGLEIIRISIEDAIAASRSEARDAFLTELRFLRLRHPNAVDSDRRI